jgi:hypothetical protein
MVPMPSFANGWDVAVVGYAFALCGKSGSAVLIWLGEHRFDFRTVSGDCRRLCVYSSLRSFEQFDHSLCIFCCGNLREAHLSDRDSSEAVQATTHKPKYFDPKGDFKEGQKENDHCDCDNYPAHEDNQSEDKLCCSKSLHSLDLNCHLFLGKLVQPAIQCKGMLE